MKHFSRILDGRPFTILTDHRPLVYAATQRSDKASPRQSRHLDYILQFNTQFSFVKGEDNVVADALSRTGTISMPALLDSATIKEVQETDAELQHFSESFVVQLRQLEIEGHDIFCEISTDAVTPYVFAAPLSTSFTASLTLAAEPPLATLPANVSGQVYARTRTEGRNSANPVGEPKFIATTEQRSEISTPRTIGLITST